MEEEESVSYEGLEIQSKPEVSRMEDCKDECKRRDGCIGWTYREKDLSCKLFDSIDLKIDVQIKWSARCSRELIY